MERVVELVMQFSDEQIRRRRKRSVAIAWILAVLVAVFFVVTLIRLGGNVANRPL
jgi:hypothetical protein